MREEFNWTPIVSSDGSVLRVLATAKEIAALRGTNPQLCNHPESELRDYKTSNGGWQRKLQCVTCGKATSQSKGRSKDINVPYWDDGLAGRWDAECAEERLEIEAVLIERTANLEFEGYSDYEAYLKTDDWIKKRDLVMTRDDRLCQACLVQPATEVHHLTYDHIFFEYLYELVSVCRECHARVHSKKLAAAETAKAKGKP